MRRREFLGLLAGAAAWPGSLRAGQTERVPRIGVIGIGSAASSRRVTDAFRQGLRDLGYGEGKTILIEYRYIGGNPDLAAGIVAGLIDLNVDAIVTAGNAVYAARRVTTTVPIVMAGSGDVVAQGFAQSLAHPGGNITGTIALPIEAMAKRLEMLKRIVPSLRRAGLLLRQEPSVLERMAPVARTANLQLEAFQVSDAVSYEAAFSRATAESIEGFVVVENDRFYQDSGMIADIAVTHRLPTVGAAAMASNGMLAGYSTDVIDMWRNAARFVDKILKGAKAGDIPIELAARFQTVINLKTARALGLDIPTTVLAAADEVIE
jgi:putative ABC transport system substrate-binding protein